MQSVPTHIALALGSNLGDRLAMLRAALLALTPIVTITAKSPIYETPAAYVKDQPSFLNAALVGTTTLPPLELLHAVKNIELEMGRKESFRYGPRQIDIDIIFFGTQSIALPELTLPHPRLAEREFVLRPLADVASDWRHPVTGKTVNAMLANLTTAEAKLIKDRF